MDSTWRAVVRKELREIWRDGRFRFIAAGFAALLLLAWLGAAHDHARERHERSHAAERSREQWIEQGKKNPHSAAHYGVYIYRQPDPLAVFDHGVLPFSGVSVFMEAHKQNLPTHASAQDGTLARRLGDWTPASVLRVLVPLLVLAMTFGCFAVERERGALLQVHALGMSVMRYAWAKAVAIGLSLLALLAAPIIAGGLWLALRNGFSPELLLRSAVIVLAHLTYLGAFVLAGVAISALAGSTREALVLSIAAWIAVVVVAPRVAVDSAATAHPTPRWAELSTQIDLDQGLAPDSKRPYEERVAALRQQTLARHGVDSVEQLPINFGGVQLIAGEEWGNAAYDRHLGRLYDTYGVQERRIRAFSVLTPSIPLSLLSMALSGTDVEHEVRFRQAAETYRRALVLRMNTDVRDRAPSGSAYTAGKALWASIPAFRYEPLAMRELLVRHASDMLWLCLWLAASAAFMQLAVRRMERQVTR